MAKSAQAAYGADRDEDFDWREMDSFINEHNRMVDDFLSLAATAPVEDDDADIVRSIREQDENWGRER